MSHFYPQTINEDEAEIVIKPKKKIDPSDVTLVALSLTVDTNAEFRVEIMAKQADKETHSWLNREVRNLT